MALKPPPKKGGGAGGPAPTPGATGGNVLAPPANPLKKTPPPAAGASPATVPAAKPAPALPVGKPATPAPASKPALAPGAAKAPPVGKPVLGKPVLGKPAAPKTPAAANKTETVEQLIAAIPALREVKDAAIFHDFMARVVPKLTLPSTSRGIIEAFANIDVNAEKVAQILKANPYYENQYLKILESHGKREAVARLEGAVVLLGMQNSRNLIIALQMLRTVSGGHAEWTKEGRLKVNPNEVLRYALKTEEALTGNKDAYADTAYAAGLMFDVLAQINNEICPEKKKVQAYIDQVYTHSLKTAQIATELSKSVSDFGYKKYVFSAGLIHDTGKIMLAILNPTYLQFLEICSKKELPRFVRHFAEKQRFGVDHSVLGALACEYFQIFRPISKAILYHHDPYLLRGGKSGLGQLASLLCLASNVSNHFKKPDKLDDPVFALWKGAELKGFAMEPRSIVNAVARIV